MDEALSTFMAVTGCEDQKTAQFFLDSSGNDIDQAVNSYMESGGAVPNEVQQADDEPEDAEGTGASVSVGLAGPGAAGDDEQRCGQHWINCQ